MLHQIIHPLSVEDFFSKYFEKQYLLIKRNDKDYFKDILNVDSLDQLIFSSSNYYPTFKAVSHSKGKLDPAKYCTNVNGGYVIDSSQFVKCYQEGYTLVLSDIQNKILSLRNLTNDVTKALGHRTGTNIYITPKDSQGFPAHYDTHDVFVLQISGTKKWRIYDVFEELPNGEMKFDNNFSDTGNVLDEFLLEEGDMLYIPRGMVHDANCDDDSSIHITLGLFGKSWGEIISEYISESTQFHKILRKYPKLYNSDFDSLNSEDISEIADLISNLIVNIKSDFKKLNNFEEHVRPANLGFFKQIYSLDSFNSSSFIYPSKMEKFNVIDKENGAISVHNSKIQLTLPAPCKEFIQEVFSLTEPKQLSAIDCILDDDSKLQLVRQLINMGGIQFENN
ncbi:cupin domain-containing protein [Flavobacterium lindanitolerans]|jgi:ribosomal protein L16 Arg81 hydroxylase|uniref:cupin domain-containing protein n=1 Tax=Flavobacterium lindanitolerans TaxID=428988 RepID=UPI0023F10CCB|nr:cupin domain-containing protein [Flavobacterium lindanitolerans]